MVLLSQVPGNLTLLFSCLCGFLLTVESLLLHMCFIVSDSTHLHQGFICRNLCIGYIEGMSLPSSFSFASIRQICVISGFFLCRFLGWKISRPLKQYKLKSKLTWDFFFPLPKVQAKTGKLPYHLRVPIVVLFLFLFSFMEGIALNNLGFMHGPLFHSLFHWHSRLNFLHLPEISLQVC